MSRVILEVNGIPISQEAIRNEAAELRQEARAAGQEVSFEDGPRFLDEAENALIDRILLDQETKRLGISVSDAEIDAQMARMNPRSDGVAGCRAGNENGMARPELDRRMRVDVLFHRWSDAVRSPTAKQIRDTYAAHRERFWAPEFTLVSHIVRNVDHEDQRDRIEAEMQEIHAKLAGGADFAETADAYSDCKGNGGRLGYISRGEMVPEFENVVFSAPLNELTPVFPTRFGFHIALVSERKPEGILSFNDVSEQVRNALWNTAREREIGERLGALRSSASIRRVA